MDTDYIGKHRDNSKAGNSRSWIRDGVSATTDPTCRCGCIYVGKHRAEVTA